MGFKFLDLERAKQDPEYYLKNVNSETSETLAQLKKDYKQKVLYFIALK